MTRGAPNQSAGLCAPSAFITLQRLGAAVLFSALSLLPLSVMAQTGSDSEFDELNVLAQGGMVDFSLVLLARDQPALSVDPDGWLRWQQQKIAIFKQRGAWQRIIDEYDLVPAGAPMAYHSWLQHLVVEAYLGQGSGESARDLLLPLIWGGNDREHGDLMALRRLVVMSYLVDGRQGDAHSAMLRYEQDYSDSVDDSWIATKAWVMIADGQPDDAALIAVASNEPEGRAVYALARLKGYAVMDEQLLSDAIAALSNMQLGQILRQELFVAALDKVVVMPVWAERITALQQLLMVRDVSAVRITAAVDGLWHAYSEHGQEVANRLQLLVGDFSAWFEAAERLQATSALQAGALYVWLTLHLESDELKAKAHEQFVALLYSQPQGDELLRTLYLSSSQYTDFRTVPLAVTYQLIDVALSQGDLAQATQLMSQVVAPQGVDLVGWQLRRARLQILASAPVVGGNLLLELVNGQQLGKVQIRYLLTVIFDLQNANQPELAYEVLTALQSKLPDMNLHREVLYWMADLRMAQGNSLEAARLYLRSAMLVGADTMDGWAQAARYQAALALINAGVVTDGLDIYRSLLTVVDDPERRALLQREIQRHSAQR